VGFERASGLPVEICFAGKLENKNYIADLAFGETRSEVFLGHKWVRSLTRPVMSCEAGEAALLIVEVDECQRRRSRGQFTFYAPCWVGGEIDLVAIMERLEHSRNAKEDLRRFRRSQLSYEVTTDREMFLRFHDEMYRPYIKNVYGDRAFLVSMGEFLSTIERGELLLVKQQEEFIAGQILLYEDGRARAWSVGIKDGDRAYVRAGAIKALDHFVALHVSRRGYRTLHQGGSRPFLWDGVLHHKRRRGLRLTDHTARWFAMNVPASATGAWAFLVNNPFIHEQEGKYRGEVFCEDGASPSEEQLRTLYSELYMNGMAGLDVYLAKPAATTAPIPPELRGKLRIDHVFGSPEHKA